MGRVEASHRSSFFIIIMKVVKITNPLYFLTKEGVALSTNFHKKIGFFGDIHLLHLFTTLLIQAEYETKDTNTTLSHLSRFERMPRLWVIQSMRRLKGLRYIDYKINADDVIIKIL